MSCAVVANCLLYCTMFAVSLAELHHCIGEKQGSPSHHWETSSFGTAHLLSACRRTEVHNGWYCKQQTSSAALNDAALHLTLLTRCSLHCLRAGWAAACVGNPANITGGSFSCGARTLLLATCTGACATGFVGSPNATCLSTGNWSTVQGNCTFTAGAGECYTVYGLLYTI